MIIITELVQTCGACPSQWEGKTDDNRQVYIRFRWGYLSVRISESNDKTEFAGVRGKEVVGAQLKDGIVGVLSLEELKEATQHKLIFREI